MSEAETSLAKLIATYIIRKVRYNHNPVSFDEIIKEKHLNQEIMQASATNVCKLLLTSNKVKDVDIFEQVFDVMLNPVGKLA